MAAGAGYYFGAAATTVVVIVALYALRKVQSLVFPRLRTEFGVLNLTLSETGADVSRITEILDEHGIQVRSLDAEMKEGRALYRLQVRVPPSSEVHETLGEILDIPGVQRVGVSGLHDVD